MRRITKKQKRRLFFVSVLTLGTVCLIILNIFSVWNQILSMRSEKYILIEQLYELNEKEKHLKVEVEKMQNPDYIARYARERYLFSRDGEINIRIPE